MSEPAASYIVDETMVDSVVKPSARGTNPNSLANLKPAWQKGDVVPQPSRSGPYVTPAMKALCDKYTIAEMRQLDIDTLKPHEGIALMRLLRALDARYGDHAADTVIARLDGDIEKGTHIEVGIMVQYVVRDTDTPSSP